MFNKVFCTSKMTRVMAKRGEMTRIRGRMPLKRAGAPSVATILDAVLMMPL